MQSTTTTTKKSVIKTFLIFSFNDSYCFLLTEQENYMILGKVEKQFLVRKLYFVIEESILYYIVDMITWLRTNLIRVIFSTR